MKKRLKRFFKLSLVGFLAADMTFSAILLISLYTTAREQKNGTYFLAALFWGCVIAGTWSLFKAGEARKRLEQRYSASGKEYGSDKRIGLISFLKNKEAKFADIVLAICTPIGLTVILVTKTKWLTALSICIILMLLTLHSFLNGRNYNYIKNINNIIQKERMNYE